MRFMVIVPANAESESGKLPDAKILADMGEFNAKLVKAGVMLSGEGLHPSSKGARLTFKGGKVTVTDGPFVEAKELIAGYWIIQTKTRQEAIDWMKRAPFGGGISLELRQIFEPEDFAPVDPTGKIRADENKLRKQIATKK